MNQIHATLITAPVELREKYRHLKHKPLVSALASCRPSTKSGVVPAVLTALKMLAQRHQFLTAQADALENQLQDLVAVTNLALLSAKGVGPTTAAQLLVTAGGNPERLRTEASFAALCGAAPVPASSGKTTRHRLSRGGDRHANSALHTIAIVRMSSDPRTRQFVSLQRTKGRGNKELLRILKRTLAREIYKYICEPNSVAAINDLRQSRRAKIIPLSRASTALGTYPTQLSRIERGIVHDRDFADRYRAWLAAS